MSEKFEDYQVEQFEQAAYQGAMLEAGKEWEWQREEFDLHEAEWQSRAEKLEAMVERLTEAGDWMVDAGENIAGVYRETWNLDDEHPSTAAWDAAVDEWNQSKQAEAE